MQHNRHMLKCICQDTFWQCAPCRILNTSRIKQLFLLPISENAYLTWGIVIAATWYKWSHIAVHNTKTSTYDCRYWWTIYYTTTWLIKWCYASDNRGDPVGHPSGLSMNQGYAFLHMYIWNKIKHNNCRITAVNIGSNTFTIIHSFMQLTLVCIILTRYHSSLSMVMHCIIWKDHMPTNITHNIGALFEDIYIGLVSINNKQWIISIYSLTTWIGNANLFVYIC